MIILAGPNGAGKSTVAPTLLQGTLGVDEFVNADVIAWALSQDDVEQLRRDGYSVHILFLWRPSAEFAIERVVDRVRRGGHSVPTEKSA